MHPEIPDLRCYHGAGHEGLHGNGARTWGGPALVVPFVCDEFRDTNIDGASESRTFTMRAEYEPDHAKRRCSAGHLDITIRRALGPYPLRGGRRYLVQLVEIVS